MGLGHFVSKLHKVKCQPSATAMATFQAAKYETYTLMNVTYLTRQLLATTWIGAFKFLSFVRFNVRIKAPFHIVISRGEKRTHRPKLTTHVSCGTPFINSFYEKVSEQINQLSGILHHYLNDTDTLNLVPT